MEGLRGLTAGDPAWIGDYRLLSRLGSGGMGRVYLARSEGGRTVAVKLIRTELATEQEFRDRFRAEVAAARKVGGRWTAPVLDADTEAEVPWVATGYIAGPTLSEVVGGGFGRTGLHGPLPEYALRRLAYGLACALIDIHGVGLIHRDLKPSNVLLTIDGPRVIDFGIVRALDAVGEQTQQGSGTVVGSPSFMSPEQVQGHRVGPASDVFCLGSVLAYAATGRAPFGSMDSGVHAVMFKIAQEMPDLAAAPAGPVRELIRACLAKEPQDRPAPQDIAARIDPLRDGDPAAPWLPAGLIAHLGRHAVRLLDTDTPPGDQRRPAPRPPEHPGTRAGGDVTVRSGEQAPAAPPAPPLAPVAGTATAVPRPADGTTQAPAPRRRRRRTLLIAAAVCALAAGAFALPAALRGGDHADGDNSSDITGRYIGVWAGPVLRDGVPTGQRRRFVISHGKIGEVVANSTSLGGTYECRSDAKLVSVHDSANRPALRLDTQVVRSLPPGRCAALGEHLLRPGPDGTLRWTAAGRTATLHRVPPASERVPEGFLGTWQRPTGGGAVQRLTIVRAPVGSKAVTLVADGPEGRCTAHADLYSGGNQLVIGPTVVDHPGPDCRPGHASALRLTGSGDLRRDFLGRDLRPRNYSRTG